MSKVTRQQGAGRLGDLLMILLCCITSFYLLASPLVPYVFDLNTKQGMAAFLGGGGLLSVVLSGIGVSLNHRARRSEPVFFRRRRE